MPRSSSRFFHPKDHGSLEYITLHLQLGATPTEANQLSAVIWRQALRFTPLDPVLGHPIAQGALVDPKIAGHLSDRFACLDHNPDRSLTELRLEPSSCL